MIHSYKNQSLHYYYATTTTFRKLVDIFNYKNIIIGPSSPFALPLIRPLPQ